MRRLLLIAAVLAGIAACTGVPSGPAVLVFHNRSDVPIALFPGVTIGPCSTMTLDPVAIERGQEAWENAFMGEDGWVPAGAIRFSAGLPGRRIGATEPLSVVVSALPLRVVDHRFPG